jgi:K+-sensing histidine kinase KdpD
MRRGTRGKGWHSVIPSVPGSLVVGVVTVICYELKLSLSITGFLYLIVVVLQSRTGDFISSAIVSVVAAACLDYFFALPIFSFQVTKALDAVALISFLLTALIITRLTSQLQQEAGIAELRRGEMKRLYGLAQELFALEPAEASGRSFSSPSVHFSVSGRSACLMQALPNFISRESHKTVSRSGLARHTLKGMTAMTRRPKCPFDVFARAAARRERSASKASVIPG